MSAKYKFTSKLTKDIDPKTFPTLLKRAKLLDAEVRVGLPEGKTYKGKGSLSGTPIAMVGAVHEFGSPERGIPERPWLRPGIRSGRQDYSRLNRVNLLRVLRGEMTANVALQQLGAMAVGKVQRYIRTFSGFAPLKPATIERKGSDKPLIDTGQMIQSVSYEVSESHE